MTSEVVKAVTVSRVDEIFKDCLFADKQEDASQMVEAPVIHFIVGFHPGRLEQHKAEIADLLDELPDDFKSSRGGGGSFLNACFDKHGNQWTGDHIHVEQLFALGIAAGRVQSCFPRELWPMLPGGMPYYVITE